MRAVTTPEEILLADDDDAIRTGLALVLEGEGYLVRAVADGDAALDSFRAHRPDLVLLDVMMPKRNGYSVCTEIRKIDAAVPILFLTARDDDAAELRGLTLGADDYMSKTISEPVMLARIAARLARAHAAADETPSGIFAFADCTIDTLRSRLQRPDGTAFDLSLREIEILRYLQAHPDEIFSRDALLTRFWGLDFDGNENALAAAVARLRTKLGAAGAHLEAVYGQGYRYRA